VRVASYAGVLQERFDTPIGDVGRTAQYETKTETKTRGTEMPKQKTDRGAVARFKITGTGKIRRRQQNRGHLLEKKSSVRTRRLAHEVGVSSADRKSVRRLLGI
jgi:large subunit ribosomal protein L35